MTCVLRINVHLALMECLSVLLLISCILQNLSSYTLPSTVCYTRRMKDLQSSSCRYCRLPNRNTCRQWVTGIYRCFCVNFYIACGLNSLTSLNDWAHTVQYPKLLRSCLIEYQMANTILILHGLKAMFDICYILLLFDRIGFSHVNCILICGSSASTCTQSQVAEENLVWGSKNIISCA